MGMGSANVFIKEYDLSEIVPTFKGVIGGIVIDSERGPVNQKTLVTNEKQLIENYGKPLPKKYGLPIYSAINFLKESNKLWVVRVDKGQTYASSLVRAKIFPTVEYDDYGYVMEKPFVDPIVQPLGPLSAEEIENFGFPQYISTREVESFIPPITIIDIPGPEDNIIYVDNSAPVEQYDKITFKDTTGMTRDQSIQYKVYTVNHKEKVLKYLDYLVLDKPVVAFGYNTPIHNYKSTSSTNPVTTLARDLAAGDNRPLFVSIAAEISVGSNISFGNDATLYRVVSISYEDITEATVTPIKFEGEVGFNLANIFGDSVLLSDRVSIDGEYYTIVSRSSVEAVLDRPLSNKFTATEVNANVQGIHQTDDLRLIVAVSGYDYTVTIGGTVYTFTSVNTNSIDILNGIASAINTDPNSLVNATVNTSPASIVLIAKSYQSVVIGSTDFQITNLFTPILPVAKKLSLVPTVIAGGANYSITINNIDIVYSSRPTDTAQDICDGILGISQSLTLPVTVVSSSGAVVITSIDAGTNFNVKYKISSIIKNVFTFSRAILNVPPVVNFPQGTDVKIEVRQLYNYSPNLLGKEKVKGIQNTIWVNNNDPVAENDDISINGITYKVIKKYQHANYLNSLELDAVVINQTNLEIGNEVFHVTRGDYEHHDAFLVTACEPGEWGNKIAIAIRDSKNYEDAFWVDVYYAGDLKESWEVSRREMFDGFGRQLFLESKINVQSRYIKVKNNEFMTDDADKLVEPMKTIYYIRQPVKTPLFNHAATTLESVWDGDNRIKIRIEDITNIDVTKPVMLGNNTYVVASLGTNIANGPIDNIIFETPVILGLDNLQPLDRFLPIGTSVQQYFDRAKVVEFSVNNPSNPAVFSITVKSATFVQYSKTYTFTSSLGDDLTAILVGIDALIDADTTSRVISSVINNKVIIASKVPGVDYLIECSSNLTATVTRTNSRSFAYYNLQRIEGSILPAVMIDSEVKLDARYYIRDAGANRAIGGDDAGYPTIGQYLIALDTVFPHREEVDILVLMDGGVTHKAYQQRLIEICEKRQDCFALLSADFDAQANPDISRGILTWRSELMINSSYGAVYTPWTKVYDKFNDMEIYIPPESWAARSISWVSANRELWYAPAGWNHARILALDVFRRYTEGERDILYDNQINPIRFAPNKGLVIWGQKTLQVMPSALDRINVRMLLIVIERALREYLEYQVFNFNDEYTRATIKSAVESFLATIKTRRGLYTFEVVCDESNNTDDIIDRNELYVDVYLQPVKVAEYITARVVITRTGVNFSEVRLS